MIGMTLFPKASLQCGSDDVQNLMFFGSVKYHEGSTDFDIASIELRGFCDTFEAAYTGVVYIRATNVDSSINHTVLVIAKMKVAPMKCLNITQMEMCGTLLVTKLLLHCGKILGVPL